MPVPAFLVSVLGTVFLAADPLILYSNDAGALRGGATVEIRMVHNPSAPTIQVADYRLAVKVQPGAEPVEVWSAPAISGGLVFPCRISNGACFLTDAVQQTIVVWAAMYNDQKENRRPSMNSCLYLLRWTEDAQGSIGVEEVVRHESVGASPNDKGIALRVDEQRRVQLRLERQGDVLLLQALPENADEFVTLIEYRVRADPEPRFVRVSDEP